MVHHRDPTSEVVPVPRHRDPTSELSPVVGRRCSIHNLALGVDGRCVRCRRADERLAQATRSHFPGWTVIIAVLVTLGALGWLFFGPRPAEEKRRVQDEGGATAAAKPDSRVQWELLGSGPPAAPTKAAARSVAPVVTSPAPAASGAKMAEDYLERVRAAARQVPIQMYYATWCPICVRAHKWMSDNQIPFTGHDVERAEGARDEMKKLNPRNTIPTFKVGKQVLEGYSASLLCKTVLNEAGR